MIKITKLTYITHASFLFVFNMSACLHHPYTTIKSNAISQKDITQFNERVSDEFKKEILEPFLTSPLHTVKQDVTPVDYTRGRLSKHFLTKYYSSSPITKTFNDEAKEKLYQEQRTSIIHEGIQLAWYYVYVGKYINPYFNYREKLMDAQKILPGKILGIEPDDYRYRYINDNLKIVEFNKRISNDFLNNILQSFLESDYHTLISYHKGHKDCSPYYYTCYRLDEAERLGATDDAIPLKKEVKHIISEGLQLAWYYACIGKYIHADYDYLRPLQQLKKLKSEMFNSKRKSQGKNYA